MTISAYTFLEINKENGTLAATNEVMMLGIDSTTRKAAAFLRTLFHRNDIILQDTRHISVA